MGFIVFTQFRDNPQKLPIREKISEQNKATLVQDKQRE